jgi:hypothetical protein
MQINNKHQHTHTHTPPKKKTYQHTRKTYRFRINLPHKHVCPIKDLDSLFPQSPADLGDSRDKDGLVGPQRVLQSDGPRGADEWLEDLLSQLVGEGHQGGWHGRREALEMGYILVGYVCVYSKGKERLLYIIVDGRKDGCSRSVVWCSMLISSFGADVGLATSAPAPVAVCCNLIFRVRVETFCRFPEKSTCACVEFI